MLRADPYLLILPTISLALIGVAGVLAYIAASALVEGFYVRLLLFGLLGAYPFNFVGTFFGVAFMAVADGRLHGRNTTVAQGLHTATTKARTIAKWALLASGVGLLLQVLQQVKADWVAAPILSWLAGAAWAVLTFFVLPVLAFEELGVRDTLRRSGRIVRDRWGEGIGAATNLASVYILGMLAFAIAGSILLGIAFGLGQSAGIIAAAVLVVAFCGSIGVMTTTSSLLSLALYRFAIGEGAIGGFRADDLEHALAPKRRWWRGRS